MVVYITELKVMKRDRTFRGRYESEVRYYG